MTEENTEEDTYESRLLRNFMKGVFKMFTEEYNVPSDPAMAMTVDIVELFNDAMVQTLPDGESL